LRGNYPTEFDEQNMFSDAKAFELAHLNQYDGKVCKSFFLPGVILGFINL
jgi:hypothetical protein